MKSQSSKSTPSTAARRPGRQRSTEVDQSILAATLDILVEEGYGEFSMSKVINRAGVSSATLYRRWNTADELVIAALRSIQSEPVDIDTGSFDTDLHAFITYLGAALEDFEDVAIAEASGPRAPDALRREVAEMFARPRMAMLEVILQRASDRGELDNPLPLTMCWTYVVSPVHHWLYLQERPLTAEFVNQTQTLLSAGLRALAMQGNT